MSYSMGERLKAIRIKLNLTQQELADRADLSKGFISQLERDLTSLSVDTLGDLLLCLGTNLKEFFSEEDSDPIVYTKEDIVVKDMPELGSEIAWLITNAQKNSLEPILVTIHKGGKSEIHEPHEGEEFGYVLKGSVNLNFGTSVFKVKKGDSFNFIPSQTHYLSNIGTKDAVVLWVSTPPSF